jgi:hypothetical protein
MSHIFFSDENIVKTRIMLHDGVFDKAFLLQSQLPPSLNIITVPPLLSALDGKAATPGMVTAMIDKLDVVRYFYFLMFVITVNRKYMRLIHSTGNSQIGLMP